MIVNTPGQLLTRREAADLLGLKAQTLAVWASTGKNDLPYIAVGGRTRYRLSAIEEWLESRTVGSIER